MIRLLKIAALLAGVSALGACTTLMRKPPPAPVAAPVSEGAATPGPIPVAPAPTATPAPAKVRCVPRNFPRAPKYPDTDAALKDAGGAADRYQLMAAGRILRMRRLADLEKLVDACR